MGEERMSRAAGGEKERVYMPVKIDPDLKAEIRMEAAGLGLSMSELVRRLVQVGYAQYKRGL